MWHLSESAPEGLQSLRRLIDRGGRRLKDLLEHDDLKEHFFTYKNLTPLQQFVAMNQGDALKKNPKGYPKDHKDIELLKLKTFAIYRRLDDDIFNPKKKPIDTIIELFKAVIPFVSVIFLFEFTSGDDLAE